MPCPRAARTPKSLLRREMKKRLAQIPPEQFRESGARAALFFASSEIRAQFKTILLFMSMKNEIDTLPLLKTLIALHKNVFLPRVENNSIVFYRTDKDDFEEGRTWNRGSFDIREPPPLCPLENSDFPALVFTPGLAFDSQGNRLGRGKGFYDRFFAEISGKEYKTAGLCMKLQIIPVVPVEAWDQRLDWVFSF